MFLQYIIPSSPIKKAYACATFNNYLGFLIPHAKTSHSAFGQTTLGEEWQNCITTKIDIGALRLKDSSLTHRLKQINQHKTNRLPLQQEHANQLILMDCRGMNEKKCIVLHNTDLLRWNSVCKFLNQFKELKPKILHGIIFLAF